MHLWIGIKAGRLQTCFDHSQTTIREDRALERLISLQADNHFVVAVDVPGLMRQQCRRGLRVDREHALLALFLKIWLELVPHRLRAF